MTGWIVFALLVGAAWALRWWMTERAIRSSFVLDEQSPGDPAGGPFVSVIVAARDEEANIETCVRSLWAQDYANWEFIIADDRSTDRTPEILARLSAESNGRLKVLRIDCIRPGWFGKSNAVREAVEASSGEWLLFCDADCRQRSRRTISVALQDAHSNGVDFLSITPVLEAHRLWEKVVQPVCVLVLMFWFQPNRVNNPNRKGVAYANGAFMLIRRNCYNTIGGHAMVRGRTNEDIGLAQNAKASNFKLRVAQNAGLYSTRMYPTAAGAWHGWSRIFSGAIHSFRKLACSFFLVVILTLGPWIGLGIAVAGCIGSPDLAWFWCAAIWTGVILLMQAVLFRVYGLMGMARRWSLCYAIGALLVLPILANAMLQLAGWTRTHWRGTLYRKNAEVNPQEGGSTHTR